MSGSCRRAHGTSLAHGSFSLVNVAVSHRIYPDTQVPKVFVRDAAQYVSHIGHQSSGSRCREASAFTAYSSESVSIARDGEMDNSCD